MKISPGQTAAVTGGSSGLGKTLCQHLARRGVAVAVADLDLDGARQTLRDLPPASGGPEHFAVRCDVRRDDGFKELSNGIAARWDGRLDLLINNAGIARAGNIVETEAEDWQVMLDTNLLGVVRGCRKFVPALRERQRAHIVNIASFAGLACAPGMVSYNVAKAGVIALSESLRAELHPWAIGVSVACPAFFATNLLNDFNAPPEVANKVRRMMQRSDVQADDVAADILRAVENERFMVITHKQARRAYLLKRLMPERFFKMIRKQSSQMYGNRGAGDDN